MSFFGWVAQTGTKIAMMAADFTPIQAVIMSLFGIVILMAILKKFEKI